jgi:hypothetical protein
MTEEVSKPYIINTPCTFLKFQIEKRLLKLKETMEYLQPENQTVSNITESLLKLTNMLNTGGRVENLGAIKEETENLAGSATDLCTFSDLILSNIEEILTFIELLESNRFF